MERCTWSHNQSWSNRIPKIRIGCVDGRPIVCEDSDCCTASDIAEVFWHRASRPKEAFFQTHKLTSPVSDTWNVFLNRTYYSEWRARRFAHGADMIPAMVEWFSHFLHESWSSLKSIKKIRFKKTTSGDLVYSVCPKKDTSLALWANVLGEFEDMQWVIHHFYAHDTLPEHQPETCINILPKIILGYQNDKYPWDLDHTTKKDLIPLRRSTEDENPQPYINKMKENDWLSFAVVADMANLIYVKKLHVWGLVSSYENLLINKEIFAAEDLFDGSCTLILELLWEPRKADDSLLYKSRFALVHKDKWETISGEMSFIAKKKVSRG